MFILGLCDFMLLNKCQSEYDKNQSVEYSNAEEKTRYFKHGD